MNIIESQRFYYDGSMYFEFKWEDFVWYERIRTKGFWASIYTRKQSITSGEYADAKKAYNDTK